MGQAQLQRIDNRRDFQIIDVREPFEFEIARIPGTTLIPLGQVATRIAEIDPSLETVAHCKGGVRSAKAIAALKQAGFQGRLINLKGGITAWFRRSGSHCGEVLAREDLVFGDDSPRLKRLTYSFLR